MWRFAVLIGVLLSGVVGEAHAEAVKSSPIPKLRPTTVLVATSGSIANLSFAPGPGLHPEPRPEIRVQETVAEGVPEHIEDVAAIAHAKFTDPANTAQRISPNVRRVQHLVNVGGHPDASFKVSDRLAQGIGLRRSGDQGAENPAHSSQA